jgi:ABC-2 type transport system permease protein
MSAPAEQAPQAVPSTARTLRRLFLTLFLRGRSSRGLSKKGAPRSVASKLRLSLLWYTLFGAVAFVWSSQPIFVLTIFEHAMTFVLVGMFVVGSAGEVLFNSEEADILLHRPIEPRALLWAKIGVLLQVSLWLAGAFNAIGLIVGTVVTRSWAFPVLHAGAIVLQTLFCTSCVVLTYQLCLRWFGRERLEQLMTATQVIVAVTVVALGQIVPRALPTLTRALDDRIDAWWVTVLPPVWFAGLSSLAVDGRAASWLFAALAVLATGAVVWLAFGKLAHDYLLGVQNLGDRSTRAPRQRAARRARLAKLVDAAPARWLLRDPAERAAFLLTLAYLFRDRDTKLRFYPGLAPFMVLPVVFLFQQDPAGFSLAFGGVFLGTMPMLSLQMLHHSQQWQAADLFRVAPLPGPGALAAGASRAVTWVIVGPFLAVFAAAVALLAGDVSRVALLLPGLVAMPVFTLIPRLNGDAVPLSRPVDEARSAKRGLRFMGVIFVAMLVAGIGTWARNGGWLWQLLLVEALAVAVTCIAARRATRQIAWPSME